MREAMNLETTKVGDIIPFGAPHWRVLDIQNDKALLLSENVIEERAYNKSKTDVTWKTCTLRRYLNGEFYDSFSAEEKARIVETSITNHNNPWYGTSGGNATTDKIFLLSLKEVVKYFGDSGRLENRPSSTNIINDQHNTPRVALDREKTATWWWLRSPGFRSSYAARVAIGGGVGVGGLSVISDSGGVRPALWLNL